MTTTEPLTRDSDSLDLDALDQALEEAGIDLLIANSKHNVGWLMNGFRSSFFLYMDAIGLSRYLPLFVYKKGAPDSIAYWGQHMENYDEKLGLVWVPRTDYESHGSADAMQSAVDYVRTLGADPESIGVELSFLPVNAAQVLQRAFPDARLTDAHFALESMRAVKTPAEIALLRKASEGVEAAMVATFAETQPGLTKFEVENLIHVREVEQGLGYEYAFITIDADTNPNPSGQRVTDGGKMLLDSGGNYKGYIGDLTRVGCFGEPDEELKEILAEVDAVQQAARSVIKAGTRGGDVIEAGLQVVQKSVYRDSLSYVSHGMGLVAHERPQLGEDNPHGYPAVDADRPLRAGMVLSVETGLRHPTRGSVGLEDTIVVADDGYEALGDDHRGWNRMGVA
jgi:Xaa-Pro aminopeptidase